MSGSFAKTCGMNGKWIGTDDGECISKYINTGMTMKGYIPKNLVALFSSYSFVINLKIVFQGYPTPRLNCPSDVIFETLPNKSFAVIKVLKPKADVNWDRDIMTNPIWVKNGAFELGVGVLHVNYTATHPISHISVSCDFTVTVLCEKVLYT